MEHRYHEQVRRRLAQMSPRLLTLAHPEAVPVDRLLVSERTERIGWHAAQALTYRDAELGEAFGPLWATYWFRIAATIPEAWAGAVVELAWDSASEATLWRDGEPLQGLNAGATARRTEARLTDSAAGGERVEVAVEMACNSWMGDDDPVRLARCELVRFDPAAWQTAWDFEVLRQLEAEPGGRPRPPRARLRGAPARRRLAGRRRGRRGAPLQRADDLGPARPGGPARCARRSRRPRARHDQARRGLRRARPAALRPHGARGTARVRLGFPFATAKRANLLEDPGEPLPVTDGTIEIPYRPFELVTLLID